VAKRPEQLNSLVQKELGDILLRDFELPDGTLATITRVESSANFQQAYVYISITPENRTKEIMKHLSKGIYGVQQQLNRRLQIRPVPKIIWREEQSLAGIQRTEELLEKLTQEK